MGGELRTLTLDNGILHVDILPELGGKLSSLRLASGPEFLQLPLRPYAPRTHDMPFGQSDASGFDECLPSISACIVHIPDDIASTPVHVPDHGDFWRVEWQAEQSADSIWLAAEGFSLPLRFEKTLSLRESSLHIGYRVTNLSAREVNYAWSAHPLFAVDPGDRIMLPGLIEKIAVESSVGERLGPSGSRHNWPLAIQSDGRTTDLSIAGSPEDGIGDKLFTASPQEGWCGLERLKLKCRISIHYDAQTVPYLGLWLCYGGWPEAAGTKQHCIALEPCTSPMDSLAESIAKGHARCVAPGHADAWKIEIKIAGVS